jgi:hypothetical protein
VYKWFALSLFTVLLSAGVSQHLVTCCPVSSALAVHKVSAVKYSLIITFTQWVFFEKLIVVNWSGNDRLCQMNSDDFTFYFSNIHLFLVGSFAAKYIISKK